ncbi:MAG: hypothetical protein M3P49_13580, partial [Actinomycetota bacterium]|nr:hypothetical protein [Actinomycetota bacterium]
MGSAARGRREKRRIALPLVLEVLRLLPFAGASAIALPLTPFSAPVAREGGLAASPLRLYLTGVHTHEQEDAPGLDALLDLIPGLGAGELGRIEEAVERRRKEIMQSLMVERRSYGAGLLRRGAPAARVPGEPEDGDAARPLLVLP